MSRPAKPYLWDFKPYMEILLTSVLAFVSTNIDDVFLLMIFFGNKRFKEREIVVGQYIGIIGLIAMSVVLSLVGLVLDKIYIGLFGLLPIYFGLRGLFELTKKHEEPTDQKLNPKNKNGNILAVAGTTIANGGDNIGIYVPLFATLLLAEKLTMISVFLIMTGVWCLLAKCFTKHPAVAKVIDRYGHVLTPFVLVFLGIYILYKGGTHGIDFRSLTFEFVSRSCCVGQATSTNYLY